LAQPRLVVTGEREQDTRHRPDFTTSSKYFSDGALVTGMLKGEVTEFQVDINLGSGEKVSSPWHPIALLPLP
jgi:hypothetical protein